MLKNTAYLLFNLNVWGNWYVEETVVHFIFTPFWQWIHFCTKVYSICELRHFLCASVIFVFKAEIGHVDSSSLNFNILTNLTSSTSLDYESHEYEVCEFFSEVLTCHLLFDFLPNFWNSQFYENSCLTSTMPLHLECLLNYSINFKLFFSCYSLYQH